MKSAALKSASKQTGRKTVVRSFNIPPKLLAELEKCAADESRTYSELVREAIRLYLKTKKIDEMQHSLRAT